TDEEEAEEEEGDEGERRERVDEQRVARRNGREDLPQPEELERDEHCQKQQRQPAEEPRRGATPLLRRPLSRQLASLFSHAFLRLRGSLPRAHARTHSRLPPRLSVILSRPFDSAKHTGEHG